MSENESHESDGGTALIRIVIVVIVLVLVLLGTGLFIGFQQHLKNQRVQMERALFEAKLQHDELIKLVDEQLEKMEKVSEAQKKVLEWAVTHHQDVIREKSDRGAPRNEIAEAYYRLGDTYTALDKPENAKKAYEHARKLRDN